MNRETFALLRETAGIEQTEIAAALDVSTRQVQRWESGESPLPVDAAIWMADRWQEFLDRVGSFVDTIEDSDTGARDATLAVYDSTASLERAGSDLTVAQADALNRALAVVLGLADFDVSASAVPEEN